MSASERMKKYRQRLKECPETYTNYLQKERSRWKQRRDTGKLNPTINEMDERSKRKQRRKWRANKRKDRDAKKARDEAIRNATVTITPPASPDGQAENRPRAKRGRKRIKRDKAAAYRKIQKLESELKSKSRLAEKYRKRYERLQAKCQNKRSNKRVTKLKKKLNQEALLQTIIVKEIRRKMLSSEPKSKRMMSGIISKQILKKYRILGLAKEKLGISIKRNKMQKKSQQITFKSKNQI